MGFLGGILGSLLGGGGSRPSGAEVDPELQNIERLQQERYKFTDPFFQEAMKSTAGRVNQNPFFAGDWLGQARKLRRPALMMLSKNQQSKDPSGENYNPMALTY